MWPGRWTRCRCRQCWRRAPMRYARCRVRCDRLAVESTGDSELDSDLLDTFHPFISINIIHHPSSIIRHHHPQIVLLYLFYLIYFIFLCNINVIHLKELSAFIDSSLFPSTPLHISRQRERTLNRILHKNKHGFVSDNPRVGGINKDEREHNTFTQHDMKL